MSGSRAHATEAERDNAERISTAYKELATVLERVDLDTEPELADLLIDAVTATEQAYRVEIASED